MGISVGLNTMVRALIAQQTALDTTAQNIANVSTPGYSRQRVKLAAVPPPNPTLPGIPGGGVEVQGIQRLHDQFIDFQRRGQMSSASYYQVKSDSLQLVQTAYNEPSDSGLASAITGFFNAWRDVSNDPGQSAMRSAVVQSGQTLAFAAKNLSTSLTQQRDDANKRVDSDVKEINTLSAQIGVLNSKIVSLRAVGDPASDLTDQRDQALDRLSQLANVAYSEDATGSVTVSLGGRTLVAGSTVAALQTAPNILNNNYFDVQWASDGSAATISSGEIGGLLDQRDNDLPTRLNDLNTLIGQIITDVNTAHQAGYALDGVTTGTSFFTGTDATNLAVDPAVTANLDLVAAAATPAAPGDGDNALTIADLQSGLSMSAGTQTYGDFYNSMVTSLGVDAKNTQSLAAAQQSTVDHLDQLQQSVSGVNLDEEMVNLTQYQRGYEAAARVVSSINEMLDALINKMV
jgi:flagellar hook-associated protein 1 FlgK